MGNFNFTLFEYTLLRILITFAINIFLIYTQAKVLYFIIYPTFPFAPTEFY